MAVNEVQVFFGPRKEYSVTLCLNTLCVLSAMTMQVRTDAKKSAAYGLSYDYKNGVLMAESTGGSSPVTDKDGRFLIREEVDGDPVDIYWSKFMPRPAKAPKRARK